MNMNVFFTVVEIVLVIFALALIYRVFKGPTIIDRVLAADAIDILLGTIIIIFGCTQKRAIFLDLGLIVTLLGFIGTVLISKYLEGEL